MEDPLASSVLSRRSLPSFATVLERCNSIPSNSSVEKDVEVLQKHLSALDAFFVETLPSLSSKCVQDYIYDYLLQAISILEKKEKKTKSGAQEMVVESSESESDLPQAGNDLKKHSNPNLLSIPPLPICQQITSDAEITETSSIGEIYQKMQNKESGLELKTRRHKFTSFNNCFVASEAVEWLQKRIEGEKSREKAAQLAQILLDQKLIIPAYVGTSSSFKDKNSHYYTFTTTRIPPVTHMIETKQSETDFSVPVRTRSHSCAVGPPRKTNDIISEPKTDTPHEDEEKRRNSSSLYEKAESALDLPAIFSFGFYTCETLTSSLSGIMHESGGMWGASKKRREADLGEEKRLTATSSNSGTSRRVRNVLHLNREKTSKKIERMHTQTLKRKKIAQAAMIDIERFFSLCSNFKNNHKDDVPKTKGGVSFWRIIFYEYMIDLYSTPGTALKRLFLSTDKIALMNDAFTEYLTFPDSSVVRNKALFPIATELVEFCTSCGLDPYNCLLGHVPANQVIEELLREKLASPLQCKAIPGSLVVVKQRKVNVPGSENTSSFYRFGRCEYRVNNITKISLSVYKREYISVEGCDCYDLSKHLLDEIKLKSEWDIPSLEKYIENPIDTLYTRLMFIDIQHIIMETIEAKGIDLKVINRANKQNVTLADVYELHKCMEACETISKERPLEVLEKAKAVSHAKIEEFFLSTPRSTLFIPTLLERKLEVQNIYLSAIPAIARQLAGNCSQCFDQLKLDRRDLLSGKTKEELVEWWLCEVEKQTTELLHEHSYKLDALPEDYIQFPPENMLLVQKNLEVLATCNNSPELLVVIKNLQDKIYPQIDSFLISSKAVISAELGLDLRSVDVLDFLQAYKEKEESLKLKDSSMAMWIEDTIEDIKYLAEMEKMEDSDYAEKNPNPHIVPVSGLSLGIIARLENEHKTALELWEHQLYGGDKEVDVITPNPAVNTQQIHDALAARNFHLADSLLDTMLQTNKRSDLSEKAKPSGDTVLHVATRHSQFKLAQKMLKTGTIPLETLNKEGDHILHCCYPVPIKNVPEQIKFFKKLLAATSCSYVNQINTEGATPLHYATLRAKSVKLSKLLVENNANPNIFIKTSKETCLHYAVRSGESEIVRILLRSKADPVSRSISGETPLDVAVRLKLNSVVNVFQGFACTET